MKILVVTPYFYPHIGGSERYIEKLYQELLGQDSTIQVDVLTYNTNQQSSTEHYKGMTIYRIGCIELLKNQFALPNYFELFKTLKQLKKNNYRIVNAHTRFFDTAWWGWLVAKYFGAKSILTDHCADHPQHSSSVIKMISYIVDFVTMPLLARWYDKITVVSSATKNFWVSKVGHKKNIVVIPNSIDTSKLYKRKTKHKPLSVRFVGRNITTKGVLIFDQVVDKLKPKYPQVLFERVSELPHKKVLPLLQETTVLVHPSTHHEGLPTILLEAGLAGCAVVATDVGGTREIIKNKITGLLVKPTVTSVEKGIIKILDNLPEAKKMGLQLQKNVRNLYSWQKTATIYGNLLKNI